MSALGKSSADTSGALVAITQIVSKGKVSMEELRQQLGERLPGAFQIAAESMGLTTSELDKLVSTGNLAAVDFLPRFAEGLKAAFGDVSYVDTYTAALNRMKNAVTEAELIIGRGGGFDVITTAVQGATLAIVGSIAAFEVFGSIIGVLTAAVANLSFSDVARSIDEILQSGAEKTRQASDAFFGVEQAVQAVDVALEGIRDNGDLWVLEPIQDYNQELVKTKEEVTKTGVELEKIASNERIKTIEAKISLDIAEVEANAEKTIAAFKSIDNSISTTTDLLGSLFGQLGEADNFRELFKIEDQIDLQNERLKEQDALQAKLLKSQIAANNARTAALQNGQALITVNGDGLQPHLEAFMWEILETIQVRVNADGLDMLLGAP